MVSEFTKAKARDDDSKESLTTDGYETITIGSEVESRSKGLDSYLSSDLKQKYYDFIDNQQPDSWEICALDIQERPILFLAIYIFEQTGLLKTFSLDPLLFIEYFISIEFHYHDENPYHNKYHGADVLQAAYYFSRMLGMSGTKLHDSELLALFFAAAVHDVDHPGKG